MLPWGSLLSKGDTNNPGFEANGCFCYAQAGCLGLYKEHPHPPYAFPPAFWETVFLHRWISWFRGFILCWRWELLPSIHPPHFNFSGAIPLWCYLIASISIIQILGQKLDSVILEAFSNHNYSILGSLKTLKPLLKGCSTFCLPTWLSASSVGWSCQRGCGGCSRGWAVLLCWPILLTHMQIRDLLQPIDWWGWTLQHSAIEATLQKWIPPCLFNSPRQLVGESVLCRGEDCTAWLRTDASEASSCWL